MQPWLNACFCQQPKFVFSLHWHTIRSKQTAERLLVQEAACIPHYGMAQVLYPELVMTARIGDHRDDGYIAAFEPGIVKFYHIPVDTINLKYSQHVIGEIRYLAIAHVRPTDEKAQIKNL
jgi:hypothetical protein